MGKVIMSGIVPLLSVSATTKPNFADNTWAQIIKACQANRVPDTWAVGNQKSMTIGGTDYVIDIIGKNHDTYSSGGIAPLTFQMHDCYGTQYAMNKSDTNISGWTNCIMRTTHLPAILALMPSEVQNGIREVDKLTSFGNKNTTIGTDADKLFLLSEIEVFGKITHSFAGEGTQYDYYKTGGSKVKDLNHTPGWWWERSPRTDTSTGFCAVSSEGTDNVDRASETTNGVSFAFCF